MTSVADAKTRLRAQVRRRRRGSEGGADAAALTALATDRRATARAIAAAAGPLLAGPGRDCIAAYEALAGEPPTDALIAAALHAGVRVLVPELCADRDLDWRRLTGQGAGERSQVLGREALAQAGVAFVPALLVDRAGRRLGQGGGSYDRALPRCGPGTLVVAVVHDEELVAGPLPVADHDARVGAVITPGGGLVLLG